MEREFKISGQHGSALAFSFIAALIIIGVISSLTVFQRIHSQQANVQVWRERLHETAYEGYVRALARLTSSPGATFTFPQTTAWATYTVTSMPVSAMGSLGTADPDNDDTKKIPALVNCVYIRVDATLTSPTAPAPRSVTSHAFVEVSNAGKYFVASRMALAFSPNFSTDIGEVYARTISMYRDANVPKFGKVFYHASATSLDLRDPFPYTPLTLTPTSPPSNRFITSDSIGLTGKVNRLPAEPIFPQLSPASLTVLRNMAVASDSYFPGDAVFPQDITTGPSAKPYAATWPADTILPPGCRDDWCNPPASQPDQHIYYVAGNVRVSGKFHGQILVVADGIITIDGDVISDSLAGTGVVDYRNPNVPYPGCNTATPRTLPGLFTGCEADRTANDIPNAHNAHQAVFVTPSVAGVRINNETPDLNIWSGDFADTLSVEAMILAPYGGFTVTNPSPTTGPIIKFKFLGSLIIGTSANTARRLIPPDANPNFLYMNTLSGLRSPPFVPGFSRLLIWQEEYN